MVQDYTIAIRNLNSHGHPSHLGGLFKLVGALLAQGRVFPNSIRPRNPYVLRLIVDTVHDWTGLRQPLWNFPDFADKVAGYDMLNEIHYRYYQFYGNMTVATIAAFGLRWSRLIRK